MGKYIYKNKKGIGFTTKQVESFNTAMAEANLRTQHYVNTGNAELYIDSKGNRKVKSLYGKGSYQDMLIKQYQNKTLESFKSKEEFNKYIKSLNAYISPRHRKQVQRDFINRIGKAIDIGLGFGDDLYFNELSDEALRVKRKLSRFSADKLDYILENCEYLDIDYIYLGSKDDAQEYYDRLLDAIDYWAEQYDLDYSF